MRYIAEDCFSDGIFVPETAAEEPEAARLNAPPLKATDALIVDALEAALLVIHAIHTTVAWHPPLDCEQCAALGKIHRALAALGK